MEKKSLKKNYLLNTSYQLLAIIAPLITTPYVSRSLGPTGIGIFNYVYAIAYVFSLLCLFGTNIYGQREIAFVQNDPQKQSKIFHEVMIIKLLAFIISSVIYFSIIVCEKKYCVYLIIAYTYLVASFFDISWFFQGLEDFKKTVIRNAIIKILGILLIFIFVNCSRDIEKYILILGGSSLLGQLYMWRYIPRLIPKCCIGMLDIKRHLKPIVVLFFPSVAIYVYTSLDKVMLGMMSTTEDVGYYSQAEKIVKLVMTIVTSLGVVMVPKIANFVKNQEWIQVKNYFSKAIRFVTFLAFPMILGIICVADEFIPLFLGDGYEKSIILLKMCSPLILIIGIASITGQAILVSMNKNSYYTMTVISGAIINTILNAILIPKYNSYGATIATLVAESVVTTLQLIGVRRFVEKKQIFRENYKYLICSFVMMSMIYLIENTTKDIMPLYAIILDIVVGIIVYLGTLCILRDDLILNFIRKYIKKIYIH